MEKRSDRDVSTPMTKSASKEFFGYLPVHLIMKPMQPFIFLIDQILAAKKKDPNADTSALEREIDKMVYALYGLTPEEIEIVEGRG